MLIYECPLGHYLWRPLPSSAWTQVTYPGILPQEAASYQHLGQGQRHSCVWITLSEANSLLSSETSSGVRGWKEGCS